MQKKGGMRVLSKRIPDTKILSSSREFNKNNPFDDLRAPEELDQQRIWKFWWTIVEDYSHRNLSYESDKLTALDGAVGEMKRLLDSEYLCGIWRRQLLLQLLWHVPKQDLVRVTHPQRPEAPSWS
jgi:hypothetical protein